MLAPLAAAVALSVSIVIALPPPEAQLDTAGEVLYGRDCAWCHGPSGEGSVRGVPLVDAGAASAHFYLSTGRMPIADPDERIRRSEPAYSATEIDALVAHVASLGDGPPVPDARTDGADLQLGGELYRQHCAQCHGASGVGVALAFDVVAPSVLPSSSTQVAEAMIVGPGAMPRFTGASLTDEETLAVVRYVEELQDRPDHGGLPFARSGRLDELLVAWGLGIGALLLAVRWIAKA